MSSHYLQRLPGGKGRGRKGRKDSHCLESTDTHSPPLHPPFPTASSSFAEGERGIQETPHRNHMAVSSTGEHLLYPKLTSTQLSLWVGLVERLQPKQDPWNPPKGRGRRLQVCPSKGLKPEIEGLAKQPSHGPPTLVAPFSCASAEFLSYVFGEGAHLQDWRGTKSLQEEPRKASL